MEENDIKKLIKEEVTKQLPKQEGFIARKLTDTPTDALSLVNRRFVTLSSNVGARPVSSVAVTGQPFFDTTSNIPMTYDGANWRNGVGSVVAGGRNS